MRKISMKSNNNIYILFIVLSMVFWNPLMMSIIYKRSGVDELLLVQAVFWTWFILSIILIYIFSAHKELFGVRAKNIVLSVVFATITFSFIVFIDGLLGRLNPNERGRRSENRGLIFEPNTRVRSKTFEFDYMTETNALGLRDREIAIDKGDKFRILCFGDSWTFGWGVSIEESWPRVLETLLKSNGTKNIEVINCGQPGQYPTLYKESISKVVPILKPDLVLVGVLQIDDLAQMYEFSKTFEVSFVAKLRYSIIRFLSSSFENIISLTKSNPDNIDMASNWKFSANTMFNGFSNLQKISFNTLDDSLRIAFRNGELNPSLMDYYINFPTRLEVFNDPNHPATQFGLAKMLMEFKEMKNICVENNSTLIFVDLPLNVMVGHQVVNSNSHDLIEFLSTRNKVDSLYRLVAITVGISYFELTDRFKVLKNKKGYYYRYDGHPNRNGHREIGNAIGEYLLQENLLNKK